jgi:signal transduction histidine kinase
LHGLLKAKRDELLACWTAKVKGEIAGGPIPRAELLDQMPAFVDELIAALYPDAVPLPGPSDNAGEHGAQRLRLGFDVSEVVQEYGLLHDCILCLARAGNVAVDLREQTVVAHCLNRGIADAVGQYVTQRDHELRRQASAHLAFIAHELRNPLNTARLALGRLRHKGFTAAGRSAELLERNLHRIAEMIESALVHSSLELGVDPKLETVSLSAMVNDLVQEAGIEAEPRQIQISTAVPDSLALAADPRLLRSALTNLINNAIKFSRPGSTIGVVIAAHDGEVTIEVADGCGGLPPGRADDLFAPLVQRGADRSGYGLGLAIALQATRAHGGAIDVRDIPGEGCVFRIVLPRSAA